MIASSQSPLMLSGIPEAPVSVGVADRSWRGPVAIGGVGGSGTRVVAALVSSLGFYLGATLNHALDNLWFTLLFQRPVWFRQLPDTAEIQRAIRLFERAMTRGLMADLGADDRCYVERLVEDLEAQESLIGADKLTAEQLLGSSRAGSTLSMSWGWKEPNTHVFLPQLGAVLTELRYIHVIRNGLDMAFSKNQRQARNWGRLFGLQFPADRPISPAQSLDFWIAANRRAIEVGASLAPHRFLLLSYDRLCERPEEQIDRLTKFVGAATSPAQMAALRPHIAPTTLGRHGSHPDGTFSERQRAAVKQLWLDAEARGLLDSGGLP